MQPGGTAIDAGANQGVFAYAFSRIAERRSRRSSRTRTTPASRSACWAGAPACISWPCRTRPVGRSSWCRWPTTARCCIWAAASATADAAGAKAMRFDVELRTIDSFAFRDVRAIKIDVEGSELAVLAGARETILRDRPPLIVELLTGAHADPAAATETICATYGYAAWLVTKDGERVEALPVIRSLGSNTTWGSAIRNRNVLFLRTD